MSAARAELHNAVDPAVQARLLVQAGGADAHFEWVRGHAGVVPALHHAIAFLHKLGHESGFASFFDAYGPAQPTGTRKPKPCVNLAAGGGQRKNRVQELRDLFNSAGDARSVAELIASALNKEQRDAAFHCLVAMRAKDTADRARGVSGNNWQPKSNTRRVKAAWLVCSRERARRLGLLRGRQ